MRRLLMLGFITFLTSCFIEKKSDSFVLSGIVENQIDFLLFGEDTINVNNGRFADTIKLEEGRYEYIQLNTWKWPKLIYAEKNKNLIIDFSLSRIKVDADELNSYLLNIDSTLIPYSLKWNMQEEDFRNTLKSELKINFKKIDSIFSGGTIAAEKINELKQLEKLKVAHRTANFISFQQRNGHYIDRNIYDFINDFDLNNKRLEKQINNRNFQYYFLLDKVSKELPDSIYPFAVIDTVNNYSNIKSIRKMIISSVVRSSFYKENINHEKLLTAYENNFGKLNNDDKILILYDKIQQLKSGNQAPSIGELESLAGELIKINDLKGKNILISVWGTWCPYCKEELSNLKNLRNKYGDKFTSVGISLDKDESKWKTYIKENNWDGIHLIDSEKKSIFKSNYLISGTNIHFLIDKNGLILSNRGMKPSSEALEELIKKLN